MKNILSLALITLISFNFFSQTGSYEELKRSALKMEEVMTYIDRMYVDTVSMNMITENAIIGMLEKLDPPLCLYFKS